MRRNLDTALIKTASRCNFDCNYCYVYHGQDTSWSAQPKRLSSDLIELLVNRLVEQSRLQDVGFAIVLHGGEPLLLGYERLRLLITSLRAELCCEKYPISLQTNGSLIDDRMLKLFADERVSVSVSIDGDQIANDAGRLDFKGNSTFIRTLKGIEALKSHHDSDFLFAGTLSVIQTSVPAAKTYDFLKSIGSPSMDFLMQDGNHDRLPKGKKNFSSTEYGDWLCELFECYVSDQTPVPIRFFDDIQRLLLGGMGTKEGQGESPYGILIFETDGEIRKNDTLRASFDGADLFSKRWNVRNTRISDVLTSEEFVSYSEMQIPTCETCNSCEFLQVCGGGMPLYRWGNDHQYNAPSIYCNDHIKVISAVKERLRQEFSGCL